MLVFTIINKKKKTKMYHSIITVILSLVGTPVVFRQHNKSYVLENVQNIIFIMNTKCKFIK